MMDTQTFGSQKKDQIFCVNFLDTGKMEIGGRGSPLTWPLTTNHWEIHPALVAAERRMMV
jgi:hypothetical protein